MMNEFDTMLADDTNVQKLISQAFEEDVKTGDVTTNAIVDQSQEARAVWVAKEEGIVAGLHVAKAVFQYLDADIKWSSDITDGESVITDTDLVSIEGKARALLTAERIALNIAQRMSGIATMTNQFVHAIGTYSAQILDTRKTLPGFRQLDKYAVKAGGGTNHRMGLYDMAMIKDNHIIAAGSIAKAVSDVRDASPEITIEVETTGIEEVQEALSANADIIMLDNMSIEEMEQAVDIIGTKAESEASGNVTLETVRDIAATGVDYISVGALTHSVKAFDISQQLIYQ